MMASFLLLGCVFGMVGLSCVGRKNGSQRVQWTGVDAFLLLRNGVSQSTIALTRCLLRFEKKSTTRKKHRALVCGVALVTLSDIVR
jgi:hypothetical protein